MNKSPLIRGDEIDLGLAAPLRICPTSNPVWQEWLEKNRAFRYETLEDTNIRFSATKDPRGYWSAFKKVEGKLRRKRLGNSEAVAKLSPAKLYSVAKELLGEDYEEDKRLSNPVWVKAELERLRRQAEESYQRGLDAAYKSRREVENNLKREIERLHQNSQHTSRLDIKSLQEAIEKIQYAVAEPNGSNKGEKGYQAKSFSKGVADIRAALEMLEEQIGGGNRE